jgi:hypothetical protein
LNNRVDKGDPLMFKLNTSRAAYAVVCGPLLCLLASGIASAQSIVKWVDAQGQTHYSDHAPTGQETEPVSVHVSRAHPASAAPAATSGAVAVGRSTAATPTTTAKETAAAREAEEEQRRVERQEAAETAKAQADKDLVAKCTQAHEIYCNLGARPVGLKSSTPTRFLPAKIASRVASVPEQCRRHRRKSGLGQAENLPPQNNALRASLASFARLCRSSST